MFDERATISTWCIDFSHCSANVSDLRVHREMVVVNAQGIEHLGLRSGLETAEISMESEMLDVRMSEGVEGWDGVVLQPHDGLWENLGTRHA